MTKNAFATRTLFAAAAAATVGVSGSLAAPPDFADYFNDGFIAQQSWVETDAMGMLSQRPVWSPFLGADTASNATAITILEDSRRGRLSFDSPVNSGTSSWVGYFAAGWNFDPAELGNDMMPPDPTSSTRVSSTNDMAMGIIRDDDLEIEDRPASFSFNIEARFSDRRPPATNGPGFRNGLFIVLTSRNPMTGQPNSLGFDDPTDTNFLGGTTNGMEIFIENDGTPGLNIGFRGPDGEGEQSMRLPRGEKFDGRISVTYTNDNNPSAPLNSARVVFTTDDGPIFQGTLTDVFDGAGNIMEDDMAETITYSMIPQQMLAIGAVSVRANERMVARQTYFDNFILDRATILRDGNPMPTPVNGDLDGNGVVNGVDMAVALDGVIPVGDDVIATILQQAGGPNPQSFLKDRQYYRAVGRWYRDNVLNTFSGRRSQKEKRADRRVLRGLRDTF